MNLRKLLRHQLTQKQYAHKVSYSSHNQQNTSQLGGNKISYSVTLSPSRYHHQRGQIIFQHICSKKKM